MKSFKLLKCTVILCAILFSIQSCSHADKSIVPKSPEKASILDIIESYCKMASKKTDGTFIFESNVTNNDPHIKNTALIGGVFYDKQGNLQRGAGPVTIGGYELQANGNGTYGFDKILPQQGLYGTNVYFNLKLPASHTQASTGSSLSSDGIGGTATAMVYSPLAITITNIAPRTPVTLTSGVNTNLTWNPDVNNPNGVVVIGEYIPTRYMNKAALNAGYDTVIQNAENVPDNGSTSIPWSFFSKFPPLGHIILWVARGNYTVASNGSYTYTVGGYTAASVWDVSVPYTIYQGSINPSSGWTYNTATSIYRTGPAVTFNRIIMQHPGSNSVSWTSPLQIGTVSAGFAPAATRSFTMTSTSQQTWNVTVYTSGALYIQLVSGTPPPPNNPSIALLNGSYNL